MRPPESFVSQPVRSLQTMLRILAEHDDRYETVVPDGVYSPQTMRAVAQFQQNHGIPVTGVTDQRTWEEIVARYEPALIFVDEAPENITAFNGYLTLTRFFPLEKAVPICTLRRLC